jgi:hypothetical protein
MKNSKTFNLQEMLSVKQLYLLSESNLVNYITELNEVYQSNNTYNMETISVMQHLSVAKMINCFKTMSLEEQNIAAKNIINDSMQGVSIADGMSVEIVEFFIERLKPEEMDNYRTVFLLNLVKGYQNLNEQSKAIVANPFFDILKKLENSIQPFEVRKKIMIDLLQDIKSKYSEEVFKILEPGIKKSLTKLKEEEYSKENSFEEKMDPTFLELETHKIEEHLDVNLVGEEEALSHL